VAENIRFARPDASMEEIAKAATQANAHGFIMNLPDGYNTLVGERGMKLSGGERQRISLARAFLKDAPILVLDEPTSSLDVHTEGAILETIQELMQGKTTIMIAHRASTLRDCNLVLILENGKVTRVTNEVEMVLSGMAARA
jgi:ATP-binding cassette subfamily B protein